MGAALVLLLVALGAMAAGVLIGRYYVPDDRQLRRTARHSRAYMRALSHLVARDYDTVMAELVAVLEENVEDVEPYFALGALFRSRGEHERAIRVHQALAVRERDRRKLRQRAMYELGLDFRAAGMPRRATRALESVIVEEPDHEGAMRTLAALYEEQARFGEAAGLWQRLGQQRGEDTRHREHHLLVAAAQAALGRSDLDTARQLLKAAQKIVGAQSESPHFFAAAAELAAARDNPRGARERLSQALAAEPGLAPHLLPGLIAAEQRLLARGAGDGPDDDGGDGREGDSDALRAQLATAQRLALTAARASERQGAAAIDPAGGAPGLVEDGGAGPRGREGPASMGLAGDAPGLAEDGGAGPHGREAQAVVGAVGAAPRSVADGAWTSGAAGAIAPASSARGAGSRAGALASDRGGSPDEGVPLVPVVRPADSVITRVLATLREIEARTGPRLELALIRAELLPPTDVPGHAALAGELLARFPGALAARVAAARLALVRGDAAAIRAALDGLAGDGGALAWTLRGRWQCAHCGHRPGPFSWRCAQCRRWGTLRMETGIEPAPVSPRERRAVPRPLRGHGLLGGPPDRSLPAPTLDGGPSDTELARTSARRSLLGRVGGWWSAMRRRDVP